jgi:hypothetical protein
LRPEDAKPEDQTYLYDKGVAVDDMKIGETYILVDAEQHSSLPFTVDSTTKQDGDLAKLKVSWHYDPSYNSPRPWNDAGKEIASDYSPYPSGKPTNIDWYRVVITPTDRMGKLYVSGGGQMVVPTKSWKAFKLDRAEHENGKAEAQLVPATRVDIDEMMTKAGAHRLSISGDGGEFAIRLDGMLDQQQLSYKSAAVRLVRDYGLKVADAETVLREADAQGKARRLVKFGQVIMQPPPPQQIGTDPLIGAQVLTPYELLMYGQTIGAPAIKQYTGPGSGFNLGGDGATQQAAGEIGRAHV